MSIPRSPTLQLIHPLADCGYTIPWLKDGIHEDVMEEEVPWEPPIIYRTCEICKKILQKDAPLNIKFCSVACRQINGKR